MLRFDRHLLKLSLFIIPFAIDRSYPKNITIYQLLFKFRFKTFPLLRLAHPETKKIVNFIPFDLIAFPIPIFIFFNLIILIVLLIFLSRR
jgi:hypothetical protein